MMTEVDECCEEKYYKVTIPSQYSKFNFVRLSNNGTTVHKDNYEEVLLYNPFGFDSNKLMWLR